MESIFYNQSNLFMHNMSIKDNISSKSFLWEDMEDIVVDNSILAYFQNIVHDKYIYLFYQSGQPYPISFQMKHNGLWRNVCKKFAIQVEHAEEERYSGDLCEVFYGLCEITLDALPLLVNILGHGSFIIISSSIHSLDGCRKYFDIQRNHLDIKISELINDFCSHRSEVVTLIRGGDGSSLNIFSLNKDLSNW